MPNPTEISLLNYNFEAKACNELLTAMLNHSDFDYVTVDELRHYSELSQFTFDELRMFSNPMEVIANKSDFLISLCEIIVGGRYGLSAEERSVIDKCVQRIYKHFIENEPSVEKMPLLSDLQRELKNEGEIALRVSNSLEMFVNGSQNLFNHRTNIDMSNRIICFDIKELGNQLKKVGMLIVQDIQQVL